jgi:hypothetical protein
MKKLATVFVALTLLFAVTSARAQTDTGTATGSTTTTVKKEGTVTLKASATFVVSNLELVVTLSNTGTSDPRSPNEILTGVFFDIVGDPHLTPVSATVGGSSTIIGHRLPLGFNGNVAGEWAYKNGLSYIGANGIDNEGISSTKLSWFKKKDMFPGSKIKGSSPLSGAQFGITTLNDLMSNDQGGIKNKALVQNTVVFVFEGLPSQFTLNDISDVNFQYGTSIKKGIDVSGLLVRQIPEPSAVSLVAVGLFGTLALVRARARRP